MKNPIIGLTSSRLFHSKKDSMEIPRIFVNEDYIKSVEMVGGTPIVIPPLNNEEALNKYIEICDGFIITGGIDIHPLTYNVPPNTTCNNFDMEIDLSNIKLIEKALEANKPMLGICRGMQLINVSLGGSLYQDINTEINDAHGHTFNYISSDIAHYIDIKPNTILSTLFDSKIGVNSIHHQAIKNLGKELIVSASSFDGIIEGIEMPNKKFLLGIQWHPEKMLIKSDSMKCIFEQLINSCK